MKSAPLAAVRVLEGPELGRGLVATGLSADGAFLRAPVAVAPDVRLRLSLGEPSEIRTLLRSVAERALPLTAIRPGRGFTPVPCRALAWEPEGGAAFIVLLPLAPGAGAAARVA
jgi:hypothetical protein